jgi:hypothetical protein
LNVSERQRFAAVRRSTTVKKPSVLSRSLEVVEHLIDALAGHGQVGTDGDRIPVLPDLPTTAYFGCFKRYCEQLRWVG